MSLKPAHKPIAHSTPPAAEPLESLLRRHPNAFHPIVPFPGIDLSAAPVFDFSAGNKSLSEVLEDTPAFCAWCDRIVADGGAGAGIGMWDEDRSIYRRAESLHATGTLFALSYHCLP